MKGEEVEKLGFLPEEIRKQVDSELHDPRLYSNLRGAISLESADERIAAHKKLDKSKDQGVLDAMRSGFMRKKADVSPASSWDGGMNYGGRQPSSLPNPDQAAALQAELTRRVARVIEKRSAAIQPASRLAQTQRVGAPRVTVPGPAGISIANASKPKGKHFGLPIPGAKRGGAI